MLINLSFDGMACPAVEIEETASVLQLKENIQLMTAIDITDQELWHQNNVLRSDSVSLKDAGVKHDDVVHVRERSQANAGREEQQALEQLLANPQLLQALPPHLRTRAQARDASVVSEIISLIQSQHLAQQRAEMDELERDEFDPEAQAAIAERIKRANIEANLGAAMEHSPEVFAEVSMLYVSLEVNNKPLKSFVDSGAQVCIMSLKCAEECNIAHLIDDRFQGVLKGVGSQKMYGRIHSANVKVGTELVPMAVTIVEHSDVDLLFGLDMLRRYQCCIDLEKNCLRFASLNVSLPFLPDHEIPKKAPVTAPVAAGGSAPTAVRSTPAVAAGEQTPAEGQAPASNSHPSSQAPAASTPLPGPSDQARQPDAAGAAVAGGNAEEGFADKVRQLEALGFPKQMCEEALKACHGSLDHAASLLFTQ